MKITSVTVENFKSFEKIELENLLHVNMLFGYNNSGKSNLFRFLELVFCTAEFETIAGRRPDGTEEKQIVKQNFWNKNINNQPFIFRHSNNLERQDIIFTIKLELLKDEVNSVPNYQVLNREYLGNKNTFTLSISGGIRPQGNFNAQQYLNTVKIDGKIIYTSEEGNEGTTFPESNELNYSHYESLMSILNDSVLLLDNDRYFVEESSISSNNTGSSKSFKTELFNMHMSYLTAYEIQKLESFLKTFHINSTDDIFNANEKSSPFQNFKFEFKKITSDKIDVMLRNSFGLFPLSSFGTGIQQIIYILSRIYFGRKKKIVLIEEIELNLSPKYQLELISFISRNLINTNSEHIGQLFYTTHSPLMCYRSEHRTLQAKIDEKGKSNIIPVIPTEDQVKELKKAMGILEHYKPIVHKKIPKTNEEIEDSKAASAARKQGHRDNVAAKVKESKKSRKITEKKHPNSIPIKKKAVKKK